MRRLIAFIILACPCAVSGEHGAHAPHFSRSIVEPFRLHHAYLEDELKLNTTWLRGPRIEGEKRADGYEQTLELGWASDNHRWGAEIFVPWSNLGTDRKDGLGDIEAQPLKYAWLSREDEVFSAALGFGLDTGDEDDGLGEGHRTFEPHFFYDKAIGAWGFGANVIPELHVSGPSGTAVEYGAIASYTFLDASDRWLPSASAEAVGTWGIEGEPKGDDPVSIVLGFHLRDDASGWLGRVGVELPVTDDRDFDAAFHFRIGVHFH